MQIHYCYELDNTEKEKGTQMKRNKMTRNREKRTKVKLNEMLVFCKFNGICVLCKQSFSIALPCYTILRELRSIRLLYSTSDFLHSLSWSFLRRYLCRKFHIGNVPYLVWILNHMNCTNSIQVPNKIVCQIAAVIDVGFDTANTIESGRNHTEW